MGVRHVLDLPAQQKGSGQGRTEKSQHHAPSSTRLCVLAAAQLSSLPEPSPLICTPSPPCSVRITGPPRTRGLPNLSAQSLRVSGTGRGQSWMYPLLLFPLGLQRLTFAPAGPKMVFGDGKEDLQCSEADALCCPSVPASEAPGRGQQRPALPPAGSCASTSLCSLSASLPTMLLQLSLRPSRPCSPLPNAARFCLLSSYSPIPWTPQTAFRAKPIPLPLPGLRLELSSRGPNIPAPMASSLARLCSSRAGLAVSISFRHLTYGSFRPKP